MLKRNKKNPKRGNILLLNLDEKKVLTIVGAFFVASMWLVISRIYAALLSEIIVVDCSGNVACFDLKIEHAKIHRNKEKNSVLDHRNNKQLKKVGSFFLVWW